MKLLFIVWDWKFPRYGIQCLSSYLKENRHSVGVHLYKDFEGLVKDVYLFKPDIIGYSCIAGEYNIYLSINREIKKEFPKLLSIFGGPYPTYNPGIVEEKDIDGVCVGEGEEALLELCDKWDKKEYIYNIKNWHFKKNDKIISNSLRPLIEIDRLPVPDFDLFALNRESIWIFTSRGCFFNCTYCFNHQWKELYKDDSMSNKVRVMKIDNVMKILKHAKEKFAGKFKYFFFDDDIFPTNSEWIKEFAEKYKDKIDMPFAINLQPTLVKDDNIKLLKSAGLFKVNMAIESGNKELRERVLGRYMSNEEILKASRIIKDNGLFLSTQSITCLPFENINLAKETFQLNIKSKADIATLSKFVPYPGTRLAELAIKFGYLERGEFEHKIPGNFHWVSLLKFKKEAKKYQMENLLNLFTLGVKYPFLKSLIYLLIKMRPSKIILKLLAHIDNCTWKTVAHQNFDMQMNRKPSKEAKLFLILLKRIITRERNIVPA